MAISDSQWTAIAVFLAALLVVNLTWLLAVPKPLPPICNLTVDAASSQMGAGGTVPPSTVVPKPNGRYPKQGTMRVETDFTPSRLKTVHLVIADANSHQEAKIVESWAHIFSEPRFLFTNPKQTEKIASSETKVSGKTVLHVTANSQTAGERLRQYVAWECGLPESRKSEWVLRTAADSFVFAHHLANLIDRLDSRAKVIIGASGLDPSATRGTNPELQWSAGVLISRGALDAMCRSDAFGSSSLPSGDMAALAYAARLAQVSVVDLPSRFSTLSPRDPLIRDFASTVVVCSKVATDEPMATAGALAYDILRLHTAGPVVKHDDE